jgi:site-specific recombinase XerD
VIESQPFWSSDCQSLSNLLNDVWDARQPSTIKNYCYSLRKFFAFCSVFGFNLLLPVDSSLAANYLSFLKHTNGSRGAVQTAFNALKWIHNFVPGINKFNDPLDNRIVKCVVESALRSLSVKRNMKEPLSADFISDIVNSVDCNSSLLVVRDCLIISFAYTLLLRHDEISHVTCSHVSILKCGLKVLIPSSKTDVLKNGKFVYLAKGAIHSLFFSYLSLANLKVGDNHFLFGPISLNKSGLCFIKNKMLSYNCYRNILRNRLQICGLNPDNYGFHSCRSGGATNLASKATQFELLSAGRWKDPRSLAHYVKIPQNQRLELSKKFGF